MKKSACFGPLAALAVLALPSVASASLMETAGITPAIILAINSGGNVAGSGGTVGPLPPNEVGTILGGEVYSSGNGNAAIPKNSSPSIITMGNFLAAGPSSGSPALLTFSAPTTYFSFLLGSPDSYNSITVNLFGGGSETFNPAQLGVPENSNQQFAEYVNFYGTAGTQISSISFDSSSANAIEVSNFSVSAVPEASTWAMMILGFLSLGFLGYRKSSRFSRESFRFV